MKPMNHKKQLLMRIIKNADNNYDQEQYGIYFESRELLPEANAAVTLIQANLIPYVYWWPHCLACCAWILGLIWIDVCSWLILLILVQDQVVV